MTVGAELRVDGSKAGMSKRAIREVLDDEIRLEREGSQFRIKGLSMMIVRQEMDVILGLLADAGADDVFLSSESPLCAKINGTVHRLADRNLSVQEISGLIGEMHMASTPGRLASGDVDFLYSVPVSNMKSWRFRCNGTGIMGTQGTANGMALAMRSIPDCPPSMDDLDVPTELRNNLFHDNGIVIVTGPTGSGKTTLLGSFVRHAATMAEGKHIISYESPPEFDYFAIPNPTGLIETSDVGIGGHLRDYASAVRNSLRRNPDIILCGEARDRETIEGAIEASMTGHLVFTTSHTNQVAPTISRMANIFPEGDRAKITDALISSVRGIIHQRLVRQPDGRGRTAVMEWLFFDQAVREELYKHSDSDLTPVIARLVQEKGYPLGRDLKTKYAAGRIMDDDCRRIIMELKR